MPDIQCDQEKIELNIEVSILTVVEGKEFWSQPDFDQDSTLDHDHPNDDLNQIEISCDSLENRKFFFIHL
jgi:hypothetical protein